MHLSPIDWIIVVATLLLCFSPALFFAKRAGKSTSEFFVSGRAVPWWLAWLSMVATTFASDTPNTMTAVIAAAWFAVKHVGGMHVLLDTLSNPRRAPDGKTWLHYLNVLPDFKNNWELAVGVFLMPLTVNWWAVWYPGSEPGGGSFI